MLYIVKNKNGTLLSFDSAVQLMDGDIREFVHEEFSPCTEQEFFSQYEKLHREKYGQDWELSKSNPCY